MPDSSAPDAPAPVGAILGSAFATLGQPPTLGGYALVETQVLTDFGPHTLWRLEHPGARPIWLSFRHGLPHRLLPTQIGWRAQAAALAQVGCRALLVTSSVGVLSEEVPVGQPMLVEDLLMPHNRLPDGTACTMFVEPGLDQGHLVLEEGLFSRALGQHVRACAASLEITLGPSVVFAYVGGPRTKTAAENRYWRAMGAQVNSMTLGPEVVLAAELQIPCAGLVVGHKRSSGRAAPDVDGAEAITASLEQARAATAALVLRALRELEPPPFGNHLYTFSAPTPGPGRA